MEFGPNPFYFMSLETPVWPSVRALEGFSYPFGVNLVCYSGDDVLVVRADGLQCQERLFSRFCRVLSQLASGPPRLHAPLLRHHHATARSE